MTHAAKKFAVAIIGRGFAALTTAVELARIGLENVVIIYDENDPYSASHAAQGISTVKGILEADAELFALKLEGHRGFESWLKDVEAILGEPRPTGVWRSGVVENFRTLESFRKDFGRIYRSDFIGAKNVRLSLDDPSNFASALYPADFWVDANYLLCLLLTTAEHLGVTMLPGRVSHVTANFGYASIHLADKTVTATCTIIAAGPGSVGLIPQGESDFSLGLQGVSGYTFQGKARGQDRCEVKKTHSLVINQGTAFWGSTSEPPMSMEAGPVPEKNQDDLVAKKSAQDILAQFSAQGHDLADITVKWGVRVRSRRRVPLVRNINRDANIWLNTAYYKSGVILAWLFAKRLALDVVTSIKSAERRATSNH